MCKLPGLNWSVARTNWSDKRLTSFMCKLPGLNWSIIRMNWLDRRLTSVGNVSGNRCESDCRSRGRKFNFGPVPYFGGD